MESFHSLSCIFTLNALVAFFVAPTLHADPVTNAAISEFVATNDKSLKDNDGESPDWIEIWNVSGEAGDLEGYYLTDDSLDLTKWELPAARFNGEGYVLVFASGKDRKDPLNELHANFKLTSSGEGYLALVKPDGVTIASEFVSYPKQYEDVSYGSGYGDPKEVKFVKLGDLAKWQVPSGPLEGWTESSFDDSTWSAGRTGIGYDNSTRYLPHIGEGGDVKEAMRGVNASVYIRVPFTMTDLTGLNGLTLRMKWEDGFIAHLNGSEIKSLSAPEDPQWDSRATSNRSNEIGARPSNSTA